MVRGFKCPLKTTNDIKTLDCVAYHVKMFALRVQPLD